MILLDVLKVIKDVKRNVLPKNIEKICINQATLEADAQRGNERAEGAEKKITDIEEELRYHCSLIIVDKPFKF